MNTKKFKFKKLKKADIQVTKFIKKSKVAYGTLWKIDAGLEVRPQTMKKVIRAMEKWGI